MRKPITPFSEERAAPWTTFCFGGMTFVIAAVSVHDAILVVLHSQTIRDFEKNPVGRWLIDLHGGEVWLFVLTKLFGAALVCAILVTLYQSRRRMALVVAGALTCFQIGLLLFLSLG
jgi:hypothetical protein